jgi:hypothetical protein
MKIDLLTPTRPAHRLCVAERRAGGQMTESMPQPRQTCSDIVEVTF